MLCLADPCMQFWNKQQRWKAQRKNMQKPTIWLCSHSISVSAVESGIWHLSPSFSSVSIISKSPRRSSTRCRARKLPMNGEVGDWQSKIPLEYSKALEPDFKNIRVSNRIMLCKIPHLKKITSNDHKEQGKDKIIPSCKSLQILYNWKNLNVIDGKSECGMSNKRASCGDRSKGVW